MDCGPTGHPHLRPWSLCSVGEHIGFIQNGGNLLRVTVMGCYELSCTRSQENCIRLPLNDPIKN